ncbi:hypothetical protein DPEC_G00037670 [Dallia pectoralis]|uniref:Uncharacterized protein n=1 Tax=Dallia pectoralis TaxID=75939 RepID=A0ACC2HDW6_DALPE|nr:hypothetical protein DPEC_G00037670 [Dallia pectoralis]
MSWIRWDLLFSLCVFISPACVSTDPSGFRKYYVLQPGPSGTDRVHVSSISTRPGAAGQTHYNVELTAQYGGQVRNRRMGSQAHPMPYRQDTQITQHQQVIRQTSHNVHQSHQMKMSGVNVCGGQCCHGWSKASGSQRCSKPNCLPQCQNGGMCLRPQLCVCKPGSKGKACEQRTVPATSYPSQPGNGHTNGQNVVPQRPIPQQGYPQAPVHVSNGQNVVPQRPIPQQGYPQAPVHVSNVAQMTMTLNQSPHPGRTQQTSHGSQHGSQFILNPKNYHTHSTHTQSQVPHQPDRPIPLAVGHSPMNVGNHTGRIKVVFTPTICKVTCMGGRCKNNCELGNTTTIISENGHSTDTLTAPNFRVVVCHLPCMNGGKCSARDKCQCPPNFTGKFCQMPFQNGNGQVQIQQHSTHIHSTHTLPLTYSNGQNPVKYAPNIVNIHVKHPPEASVQIHQVSQLDASGQKVNGNGQNGHAQTQSHYTYHHSESRQKFQQQGHNIIYPTQQRHQYQPVTSKSQLGRCFQETTGVQCGKVLPGLSKQEECCQTIGTSWGFHKCQMCPKPSGGSRQPMDCPQGYKRINNSHCQDLDECQLQGVCPNGDCLNTIGSYRCICKAGYIPDSTFSTCIPDTHAVYEEKGSCFRLVSSGKQCLHPVSAQLSKQLCCCSVGKAWGTRCEKCPLPGTAKFKEICPGGMGYTVTGSYKPKPPNHPPKPPTNRPIITYQEPVAPPLPFPTPEKSVEALSVTEKQHHHHTNSYIPVSTDDPEQELVIQGASSSRPIVESGQPQLSPGVFTMTMEPPYPEVVEKTSPPAPALVLPSNAGQDIAPTQSEEVDECQVNPDLCGSGICYNTVEGYTCVCDDGFLLDETHNICADINECLNPNTCSDDGFCINKNGSYICHHCDPGFRMTPTGQCEDINECLDLTVCQSGMCVNFPGSYDCTPCPDGFYGQGEQCVDVDECLDPSTCANGKCSNREGNFICSCNNGFTLSLDGQSCQDVDECQDDLVCTNGHCQNTQGSFNCTCGLGFTLSLTGDQCHDVDECQDDLVCTEGHCQNNEGSFVCICELGFTPSPTGDQCHDVDECLHDSKLCSPDGRCINTKGSFNCFCELGFTHNMEAHTCDDIDECLQDNWCEGGHCENTHGSYRCRCDDGYQLEGNKCLDINECLVNRITCGPQGLCSNTEGSFHCQCDQGYQESSEGYGCVDINECELLTSVCGEAKCVNKKGSFQCECPDPDQNYNQMTAKCSPVQTETSVLKKECYFNLNDENLCENVLTGGITMEECCCTLGAGWGDNCEVHPCPVVGTDQYIQVCPAGRGNIPSADTWYGAVSYQDADECALFGTEICKGGYCLNSPGTYECYCETGLYYDEVNLQCRDIDECLDASNCVGGLCANTQGSYTCLCDPPLLLDSNTKNCVNESDLIGEHVGDTNYQRICWRKVTQSLACSSPMDTRRTTYTECCCLYGEAWGMECALCPPKTSEDYASMCNLPVSERPGRPYGRDALVASPVHEYDVGFDYEPGHDQPGGQYEYEDEENPFNAFEGLRAEECGVLNGCENGRCVRVQEGYTCDCFDGYTLDMSRMACVDVNECSELNNRMSLCKNAKCINTQGSYKCVCLPGYTPSEQPNYCVAEEQGTATAGTQRQ